MRKTLWLAAGMVAALAWAQPAAAAGVPFVFSIGGTSATVTTLDWKPGNSMLTEDSATHGTVLFQANLNSVLGPNGDIANGTNGIFITAVAGFAVNISTVGNTSTLTLDPAGSVNFFKIYATTTPLLVNGADDLAGKGFTTGTEILSGHALVAGTSSTVVTVNPTPVPLDNFGTNNYPNITTTQALGSTDLRFLVDSHSATFFPNFVNGSTLGFHATAVVNPYSQQNPSGFFSSNGVANGDVLGVDPTGVAGVGLINGLCVGPDGPDAGTALDPLAVCKIAAQSDAATTFEGVAEVPEPATMSLLGLGLLGSAAARRRQLKAKKAA